MEHMTLAILEIFCIIICMESERNSRTAVRSHTTYVMLGLAAVMILITAVVLPLRSRGDGSDAPSPTVEAVGTPDANASVPPPDETPGPSPSPDGDVTPAPTPTVYVKTAIVVDDNPVLVLASRQAAMELMQNVQLYFEELANVPDDAVTVLLNSVEYTNASAVATVSSYDDGFELLTGRETPLVFESVAVTTGDEVVPYCVNYIEDSALPVGTRIVTVYGRNGINHISYSETYHNGVLIRSELLGSEVVREALDGEIRVGTREFDDDYEPDDDFGEHVPIDVEGMSFLSPILDGEVIRYFGPYGSVFHHGIDIAAELNSTVCAAFSGRVVAVMERGDYGLLVEVEHEGGYTTRYAQLASAVVSVGDTVFTGQVIGTVGVGGSSEEAHLHFELRLNGFALNPLFYFEV